jgi:large subunit ribosomal protein L21
MTMFAVVDIAGFQEKVKVGDTLSIPLQDSETDKKIVFGNVLMLVGDKGDMTLGAPFVKGASVEVKVLSHGKDAKIRVFRMRRRKRFMRTKGHKQQHTNVEVTAIKI